mmetsp:Transcript_110041/g.311398  ORF Transcript_110041/g.311398 Transcript_110041/m.311398 type:complete len:246 (+) Transcript_110041:354-1091(+)
MVLPRPSASSSSSDSHSMGSSLPAGLGSTGSVGGRPIAASPKAATTVLAAAATLRAPERPGLARASSATVVLPAPAAASASAAALPASPPPGLPAGAPACWGAGAPVFAAPRSSRGSSLGSFPPGIVRLAGCPRPMLAMMASTCILEAGVDLSRHFASTAIRSRSARCLFPPSACVLAILSSSSHACSSAESALACTTGSAISSTLASSLAAGLLGREVARLAAGRDAGRDDDRDAGRADPGRPI